MKKILLSFLIGIFCTLSLFAQNTIKFGPHPLEPLPTLPEDPVITQLIRESGIDPNTPIDQVRLKSENQARIFRKLSVLFYEKDMQETAKWYMDQTIGWDLDESKPVIETIKVLEPIPAPDLTQDEQSQIEKDKKIIESIPQIISNMSAEDLDQTAALIDKQIDILIRQRDSLKLAKANPNLIKEKEGAISTLEKQKEAINIALETIGLKQDAKWLKRGLVSALIGLLLLLFIVIALLQRRTIKDKDSEIEKQLADINKKNTYLEYAAKIIRHDIHSGINTYIPRGLNSLERKLNDDDVQKLGIANPLKMIKDGLAHTQKVYKNVFEFTNLAKPHIVLNKVERDLSELLNEFLNNTSYSHQVEVGSLPKLEINEVLFSESMKNLISNGLRYNDSNDKKVKIYTEGDNIVVEDNGRGLDQKTFDEIVNQDKKEGLGLSMTKAILEEHGYKISCSKLPIGTKFLITYK